MLSRVQKCCIEMISTISTKLILLQFVRSSRFRRRTKLSIVWWTRWMANCRLVELGRKPLSTRLLWLYMEIHWTHPLARAHFIHFSLFDTLTQTFIGSRTKKYTSWKMSALIKSLKFAQIINKNPVAIYTVARNRKLRSICFPHLHCESFPLCCRWTIYAIEKKRK